MREGVGWEDIPMMVDPGPCKKIQYGSCANHTSGCPKKYYSNLCINSKILKNIIFSIERIVKIK